MSLASISRVEILKDRAKMVARCRAFFENRGVTEVDVPILSHAASVDLHIELVQVLCCGRTAFLHSSPEFGMKRLLAEGIGDIYQLSHVFRDHEKGERHTVEFMMAEWYRMGFTFQEMIEESVDFIRLFLIDLPDDYDKMTYQESFVKYAGRYPESLEERDLVYAFEVEPHFGQKRLTIITDFPAEQAALARIGKNGMAERFEIYYKGIELANGYHELLDSDEQLLRMKQTNSEREKHKKNALPIDFDFLQALEKGIPDCCGVAVGFDRLMMLRHQLEEIRDASCFFI